jgi:hypothetical protein
MTNFQNKFGFLFAILICVAIAFACNKKDSTSEKEDSKEDTKKETTTKETTKEDTKEETRKEKTSSGNSGGSLYFVEDYKNGEEIGKSDRFTTGWLTVMVRTDEPIGVGKVELRVARVSGGSEKIMDTIPFDVQPDWTYTYFQDKSRLKFSSPGTYKVTLQKVDGSPIVSGEVEVISR